MMEKELKMIFLDSSYKILSFDSDFEKIKGIRRVYL
jgi:hypothetical protein